MKILLDLQGAQTESRFRGIGRQAIAFAKALLAADGEHEIHILLNRRLDRSLSELLAEFAQLVVPDRIHLFGVPGGVAERDPGNLWRTYVAEQLREAAIARIAPDIVHIASLFEGYVDDAVTSIGRFDAPHLTAVTLHDLIPLADPGRYLADESVRRHWLRRAQHLKRADLLLAVSAYSAWEADQRLSIPADRITVISGGVSPVFSPEHAGSKLLTEAILHRLGLDGPYLLHVGAVDPRKNVELIIAAFAKLTRPLQDGHLIAFVGPLAEEDIGQLKIVAARHGVPVAKLRFCPFVSEEDLVAIYRAAGVVVFPSMLEGFGLPAVEGMASGAPTLVADATALREIVTDLRYRFDPRDPGSLAARLEEILVNPSARSKLRSWAIARAAEFTWNRVAHRALDGLTGALERKRRAQAGAPLLPFRRKPLMAFFSPLPADRSGIADYSAELLRELARFYEIECVVVADTRVTDPWLLANFVIRDYSFFRRNAGQYDRVVYSIGNSHFHADMLDLLQRYPGIVILHDFFLSDLIDWMSNTGKRPYEDYFRELYRTHGLTGLAHERREGRHASVTASPCNALIFQNAIGVIVHSRYALEEAKALHGHSVAAKMAVIPHLRAIPLTADRAAARARLGIAADEFVVASFGILTPRKCSDALLSAWVDSRSGSRPGSRIVFVGDLGDGTFEDRFRQRVAERRDVTVTGYVSPETYRDYLAAADLAIQLRKESRGETSGTILDCLAAGLPLIINDHGAAGETPDAAVVKLPGDFSILQLRDAIDSAAEKRDATVTRAEIGKAFVRQIHHPSRIGDLFHTAIESFETALPRQIDRQLLHSAADFVAPVHPDDDDLRRVACILGESTPRIGMRQILFDVTVLAESDAKTGIQRVVRSILTNLIERPPGGFRIEPVRMDGHQLRYARRWVAEAMDLPSWVFPDDPVDGDAGDIYLSIDWVPDRLPLIETWLADFRRAGGRVVIGVHDLLPFQLPQYFPAYMPEVGRVWFGTALRIADQFVCVSRSVADDVVQFGKALRTEKRGQPIAVDFFHNAADLDASLPTKGLPDGAEEVLAVLSRCPSFLMVGTVEPRKGHLQVLDGFERLWREGADVNLIIVGKSGWMMDDFLERVRHHPEHGQRLFWLHGISDEYLEKVYDASTALIAASYGEGFGLPLIEAAKHGTPVIARSIPVFREVAGQGAFYFDGETAEIIAEAISRWLTLRETDGVPSPSAIRYQNWAQSTEQLVSQLFESEHYANIP